MRYPIFLFGEAEKGEFCTPHLLRSLPQLAETFGNPPEESDGIRYAVQALLLERELFYYRVKEEGFSVPDYMRGLKLLEDRKTFNELAAICMPGVGDPEIIDATNALCIIHQALLITTEKDLYDYLTQLK
jgi:hypothetical protein